MTERPILFSAEMVRALLNGSKTQTRRIMKPQPQGTSQDTGLGPPGALIFKIGPGTYDGVSGPPLLARCPYGQPGDRLWVRETASLCSVSDQPWVSLTYEADKAVIQYDRGDRGPFTFFKKTPSIHMPRWACRLWLELTEVRVERLQEISRGDAKAEGFLPGLNGLEQFGGKSYGNAQLAYRACWESINGDGSWAANPYVWVLSFQPTKGARDE